MSELETDFTEVQEHVERIASIGTLIAQAMAGLDERLTHVEEMQTCFEERTPTLACFEKLERRVELLEEIHDDDLTDLVMTEVDRRERERDAAREAEEREPVLPPPPPMREFTVFTMDGKPLHKGHANTLDYAILYTRQKFGMGDFLIEMGLFSVQVHLLEHSPQ
jgi:hypothetical protein